MKPYYDKDGITIYNQNCFDVLPTLIEKFDLILADMPYNTTACDWDKQPIDLDKLWETLKPLGEDNCAYVFTTSQPFTSKLVMSNLKWFKYEYSWIKTKPSGFQNAKKMPMKKHEEILVFYENQPTFNQQNLIELKTPIKSGRARLRNNEQHKLGVAGKTEHKTTHTGWQDSLLHFANPSGKGHLHPTQKPVALMEYLIKIYTNEGDLVLDPFAGSFTTAVACKNLNRRFIGIEILEKYCKVGVERLKAIQPTLFTN